MTIETLGILGGLFFGLFGSAGFIWEHLHQKKMRMIARERAQEEREKLLRAELDLKDRLLFLSGVIMDKTIPIKSRQPFYDEYIAKGGRSVIVKCWLEETAVNA